MWEVDCWEVSFVSNFENHLESDAINWVRECKQWIIAIFACILWFLFVGRDNDLDVKGNSVCQTRQMWTGKQHTQMKMYSIWKCRYDV